MRQKLELPDGKIRTRNKILPDGKLKILYAPDGMQGKE